MAIDPSNWAVLQNAIANRWANSIVFFVDGCCEGTNGNNAGRMLSALNAGALASFTLGSTQGTWAGFPLNSNSPFAPSFNGLNPVYGGYFSYINNVPSSNALYLATGVTTFPPAGTAPVNSVYGLLIPTSQSNSGGGACIFAVVDISLFASSNPNWADNRTKIAPAFINAATSENGACGLPKVSKSFDKADIYLGGSGNTATLTITLSNSTPSPINNVQLTDNLPAPLVVAAGTVGNTCTAGNLSAAPGTSVVSNTGFTIPSGGCAITVPVAWPNTEAGRQACVSSPTAMNTITPGVDFVSPTGQVNTPTTASLTCHAAQLNVSKLVQSPANVPPLDLTGASFPVSVICTGTDGVVLPAIETSIVLSSANSGSSTIVPVISSGTCVATETSRPALPPSHFWIEDPLPSASSTMAIAPAINSVQLINTLARANSDITINKTIAGGPVAGMSGTFNFTASCGPDGNFSSQITLNGSSSGAIAITNVPFGARCTVSEDPVLPVAPGDYAWNGTMPGPVTLTTSASGNVASFVNTLVRKPLAAAVPVPALDTLKFILLITSLALLGMYAVNRRKLN
ncbi:DUF5979 domain-containing protein [Ottowia thiooxydans]|uniref:DUF5979 domain-containing protein n=1 Tax=Ottowia thiooxydans TaxID=219182 RepID=UPI001B7FB82C|nr:DUF5979 domain-containing protein [Ottowia thiooxydans]